MARDHRLSGSRRKHDATKRAPDFGRSRLDRPKVLEAGLKNRKLFRSKVVTRPNGISDPSRSSVDCVRLGSKHARDYTEQKL